VAGKTATGTKHDVYHTERYAERVRGDDSYLAKKMKMKGGTTQLMPTKGQQKQGPIAHTSETRHGSMDANGREHNESTSPNDSSNG